MLADYLLKTKKEYKKNKETGDSRYIYQNELGKACFEHDMPYGGVKNLSRTIASNKVINKKELNIAKNPEYDRHLHGLAPVH